MEKKRKPVKGQEGVECVAVHGRAALGADFLREFGYSVDDKVPMRRFRAGPNQVVFEVVVDRRGRK